MRQHGRKPVSIGILCRAALLVALPVVLTTTGAGAATIIYPDEITGGQLLLFVILIGAVAFAVVSAVALMRARNRAETENAELRLRVANLGAAAERAEAIAAGDDQRLVAWGPSGDAPAVAGSLPDGCGAPRDRAAFLAFGTWLQPESAGRLDRAVGALRERGESFAIVIATNARRLIEASGRGVGGTAVVRFRDLTGDRLARAEAETRYDLLLAEVDAMRTMLATAPMPIWLRDDKGELVWVNAAYAAAVDASEPAEAIKRQAELLDANAREIIRNGHAAEAVFARRLPAIVSGARRLFDVIDVTSPGGSAGIAADATAVEAAEAALRREVAFNARTLDQLATAVAIVGADRRLRSANTAFRNLFRLDAEFLASGPEESAIFDRLRATRQLPEQADFRSWRAELANAYRAAEAREFWWHLPDGRTLRVIANPNSQGGVTWIYENVTERLDLESRYNALIEVQGETIDHLSEGVAVFGSNGRLRLRNPALAAVLGIDPALLAAEPHVADFTRAARRPGDGNAPWPELAAAIAGLDDNRAGLAGRLERSDGRVIDYATVPLPDGQTMATFVDVTDKVNVERALTEKNEALEAAASLKNAFIHHVSYELRSPLTSIIGFAQLLTEPAIGTLNERQREYAGYVLASGNALLALVNDILDLATIDAGIMELDLAEIDVAATVRAAVDGVRDRLEAGHIRLETQMPAHVGTFVADGKRVRQVIFNLLANAIGFSPEGGRVVVAARRDGGMIEFTITDEGPGMPPELAETAFDRFASQPRGSGRGGVGLGLSIVKSFVALHGGTVAIASQEGQGASVTVRLPARPGVVAAAAE